MADSTDADFAELSYRDVQHKLKEMGLPAKGCVPKSNPFYALSALPCSLLNNGDSEMRDAC